MTFSNMSALQLFLRRLTARSRLTREEQEAVLGLKSHAAQVPAHVDFVEIGEHVDHACLIADGLAGRFEQVRDGRRQITALHIAGDMADLPSVVSPKVGWALAALTTTTILRVPHAELRRVAVAYPALAEAFWRDCVVDSSIFSEWVVNVGRRDAKSRLAHLLCEMALRIEQTGSGDRSLFKLALSQADLADVLGLTSVHVNRTLQRLRIGGMASMAAGSVTISNWDELVRVADFDETYLLLDGQAPRLLDAA